MIRLSSLAALIVTSSLSIACSDDDSPPAAVPDGGLDAQPEPDSSDALSDDPGDAAAEASPDASTALHAALFVISDFASSAELVAIAHGSNEKLAAIQSSDQDAWLATSNGWTFLLERTNDKVTILDEALQQVGSLNLKEDPNDRANPYSVLVANDRGYIVQYAKNSLAVFNLNNSERGNDIDLSEFVDDEDGLVDAYGGFFHEPSGILYVGLQRINQTDFSGACIEAKSLLVGIRTDDDTVVDLNGEADGKAIVLEGANPQIIRWDAQTKRAIVLSAGCVEPEAGTMRSRAGIEAAELEAGATSWLWHPSSSDRPAALVWIDPEQAVVGVDDEAWTRHWMIWNPSQESLGEELDQVPAIPVYDGTGGVVGLSTDETGAAADVVRFDLTTKETSTIAAHPFGVSGYPYVSASLP